MKAIIYTKVSSDTRLGAWEYLRWGYIQPIKEDRKVVAAKVIVYPDNFEDYFTLITSKAIYEL
jgi:hypothetical protein